MPDFTQFIKLFNQHFPLPRAENSGGSSAATNTNTVGGGENFSRFADSTWRMLVASDAAPTKETNKANSFAGFRGAPSQNSGKEAASSPNTNANGAASSSKEKEGCTVAGVRAPAITIGRMQLSPEDRWKIQAALRREEAKAGQARREYNKKVTRAVIVPKGPSSNPADAFPPGRGRPVN